MRAASEVEGHFCSKESTGLALVLAKWGQRQPCSCGEGEVPEVAGRLCV